MGEIHPTAILDGTIECADDARIGPHCVIRGDVTIGSRTQLCGNVYIEGPMSIGSDNRVYPFVCLGFAPQHRAHDHESPGRGVVIGDGNTIREGVTVHRAFADERPTTVGSRNYIMANAHIGHDAVVADDCTLTHGSMLGGHTLVEDRVIIGGGGAVHQFCRIGTGAMVAGIISITQDLLPWFTATETNYCGSLNLVGMRRSGLAKDVIDDARWAFRIICRSGLTTPQIIERLRERAGHAIIDEYVRWIETSDRGYCAGRGRTSHGSGRRGDR